jgi:hypothetical protein
MHNVNVDAVEQTAAKAKADPAAVVQHIAFDGEWQTAAGAVQFRATIPVPNGKPVVFEADFPPPMGGTGSAPNPLAYCFWGGLLGRQLRAPSYSRATNTCLRGDSGTVVVVVPHSGQSMRGQSGYAHGITATADWRLVWRRQRPIWSPKPRRV